MTDDVIGRTRAYIHENFLYMRRDYALQDSTSLLGDGVLDSMGVMELVQFLESTFGIEVGEEDITEENFGSLQAVSRYVHSRQSAARQSA